MGKLATDKQLAYIKRLGGDPPPAMTMRAAVRMTADLQRAARKRRSPTMAPREDAWWWTLGAGCRCWGCFEWIPDESVRAYRHDPKRVLCEICVERQGLVPRESKRLRASKHG